MHRDRGVTFRSLPERTRDQPPYNLALFASSPVTDDKPETGNATKRRQRPWKEMQGLTARLTDGTVCKAISANLLCRAGIYASTLYGTLKEGTTPGHTHAHMIVLTLGIQPERYCDSVCACVCASV